MKVHFSVVNSVQDPHSLHVRGARDLSIANASLLVRASVPVSGLQLPIVLTDTYLCGACDAVWIWLSWAVIVLGRGHMLWGRGPALDSSPGAHQTSGSSGQF